MQHVIMFNALGKDRLKPGALRYIREAQIEGYTNLGDFSLFAFDWYDIHSDAQALFKVVIYMDDENLFFVCGDNAAYRYVSQDVSAIQDEQPTLTNQQLLYRFFIRLFRGDMDYLERIEDQLDATMNAILAGNLDHALDTIAENRRELVRLKRYYEQINIVFDDMLLDDASLFDKETLDRLAILDARTDRYAGKVQNLQAIVSQMQDTYQAQLSIQQNDLMKVFTIVTAIFLPLTLLVGWYGMNFTNMPELHWRYGYPAVILFSIAIVIGLFWYFKHKKWL
ncbi:MAG: CorA family divalent cation transporter [Peptococcaceae bacterium]|nr:CorA family divalent cation transporter [Peptococcaceae bacterium]